MSNEAVVVSQASTPGKIIRAPYIFDTTKTVVVAPVDDHFISGPIGGMENPAERVSTLAECGVDAIMAFPGLVSRNASVFSHARSIVNLTGSTTRSFPTRKAIVGTLETALRLNASAVAVHINCGPPSAAVMIEQAAAIVSRAARYELPVIGTVYPRGELEGQDDDLDDLKARDNEAYCHAIAHAVAVGAGLGFDAIKTKYTGDSASFVSAIRSANGIPVLISGGPLVSDSEALNMAVGAMAAGAAGVSFGRNFFGRRNPESLIAKIRLIRRVWP
jgi:DhnA family fructose-bisphosphate aldolase class Ia